MLTILWLQDKTVETESRKGDKVYEDLPSVL